MNIVGNSVKNNYNNYNHVTADIYENSEAAPSYFKAPQKPRYISQATKIDQVKLKMLQKQ